MQNTYYGVICTAKGELYISNDTQESEQGAIDCAQKLALPDEQVIGSISVANVTGQHSLAIEALKPFAGNFLVTRETLERAKWEASDSARTEGYENGLAEGRRKGPIPLPSEIH